MENDLIYKASCLIYKGIHAKSNPMRDKEYKELIVIALSSSEFMAIVESIADGLLLSIVDISEKGIIIAPKNSESSFSMGVVDYRKELQSDGAEAGIGLAALVQIAVAFTIFPTDDELDDDDTVLNRSTTIKDIYGMLIKLCGDIVKDEDSENFPVEMKTTAESILELPVNIPTQTRPTFKSLSGAVTIIVSHLEESGLLKFEDSMTGGFYFPTYKYHKLIKRRGAGRLFDLLHQKMS